MEDELAMIVIEKIQVNVMMVMILMMVMIHLQQKRC